MNFSPTHAHGNTDEQHSSSKLSQLAESVQACILSGDKPAWDGGIAAVVYCWRQSEVLPVVYAPVQVKILAVPHTRFVHVVQDHLPSQLHTQLHVFKSSAAGAPDSVTLAAYTIIRPPSLSRSPSKRLQQMDKTCRSTVSQVAESAVHALMSPETCKRHKPSICTCAVHAEVGTPLTAWTMHLHISSAE